MGYLQRASFFTLTLSVILEIYLFNNRKNDNMEQKNEILKDSYKWLIVLAGAVGLFASLGLGRFSLGVMLPAMSETLGLSYSQMGVIGTVNFCGYLGAVLLCGTLTRTMGSRRLISVALLLVSGSMILVSLSHQYWLILCLYFLTGVGSALSNVPIMALVASWFEANKRGRAAGLCVMGNGLGILLTGKLVPFLNTKSGDWRLSWLVLGTVVGLISFFSYALFREKPAPEFCYVGDKNAPRQTSVAPELPVKEKIGSNKIFYQCGLLYFLFGFTYVIYVTFFVTSLVQDRGLAEITAGNLWSWVGFLSLASGPCLGYISDQWSRKTALLLVFSLQTVAYLLFASHFPMVAIYLSIISFGLVAFSIPPVIAAFVADYAGPQRTAAVFGFVTFVFGLGQIVGPVCAGYLAEYFGTFSSSFLLAAVLTAIAVVQCLFLPGKNPG